MKILLQFPEGLKQKGFELAKKYEAEGHEVFLSASGCYGACDLALDEARCIKADKIVHVGHNKFVKTDLPIEVEYIPYSIDIDVESFEAVLPHIENHRNIALATTVQHIHQFDEMKAFLEKNGKNVFAEQGELALERGQVLGCDSSTVKKVEDKVDAVLFIGTGRFHVLAIDMKKPVFAFNPDNKTVTELSKDVEKLKKQRKGAIAKALTCKKFGIFVSTKVGQFNMAHAQWAKEELVKRGFEAAILVANEISPMALNNFVVFECFINTACPRIADDRESFGKPVLNISMLKELFEIIDSNKN